jgi:hypothetical protein
VPRSSQKNSLSILAVAPSRRDDVQVITRRVGERTALAGRCLELRRLGLGLQTESLKTVAAFGRRLGDRTIRTGDFALTGGRRAAGMFGFCSARALSSCSVARRAEFSKLKTAIYAM